MPKLHALVVAGSMNEERRFGLISGRRVADALAGLGWKITLADAAQPLELISTMANGAFDLIEDIGGIDRIDIDAGSMRCGCRAARPSYTGCEIRPAFALCISQFAVQQ